MFVYKVKLEQPRKGGKSFNLPTYQYQAALSEDAVRRHYEPRFEGYRITVTRATMADLTANPNFSHLLLLTVEV